MPAILNAIVCMQAFPLHAISCKATADPPLPPLPMCRETSRDGRCYFRLPPSFPPPAPTSQLTGHHRPPTAMACSACAMPWVVAGWSSDAVMAPGGWAACLHSKNHNSVMNVGCGLRTKAVGIEGGAWTSLRYLLKQA